MLRSSPSVALVSVVLVILSLGAPAPRPAVAAEPPTAAASDREVDALRREIGALRDLLTRGSERLEALEQRLDALTTDAHTTDAHTTDASRITETATTETATTETATTETATTETATTEGPPQWSFGYKENGGGFFMRSPDGDLSLRLLGYAQVVGGLYHDDFERADSPGDLSIRRARLDWLVEWNDRYTFFVEIDGGPGSTPGSSDFALVEAKLITQLLDDGALDLVVGKYVSPFSSEDRISSRSLDTIERYIALNSLFLLPATDVQFGVMLRGRALDEGRLQWYAGLFNGNGRANDNLSDDNGDKEVQLKLNYQATDRLKLGLGFDYSNEEAQSLQLRGLTFTPYTAIPVEGTRVGWGADFAWVDGPRSLRGEGLAFDFEDADAQLTGGFLQGGYFLRGDAVDGLQLILRGETAVLDSDVVDLPGDRIDAVTLGLNVFYGGNWRLQMNAISERYDGPSNLPAGSSRVEGDGWKSYLLTELQLKF